MKLTRSLIFLLASTAALSPLSAVEIWTKDKTQASGYVSRDGGYFDADKQYDGTDNWLCWAASASNMIAWWQNQNPGAQVAAPETPSGIQDIWQTYKDTFYNTGADRYCGIDWWFEGDNYWIEEGLPSKKVTNPGGYYKDLITDFDSFSTRDLYQEQAYEEATLLDGGFADISLRLKELLEGGCVVGLNINPVTFADRVWDVNESAGHAITLWGIDYDETKGVITKMWVSDSDDTQNTWQSIEKDLFEIDCTPLTVKENVAEYYDTDTDEWVYAERLYQTCTFESELLDSMNRFYRKNDMVITGYTYLQSNVAYMDIPEVPEPATGGLALLGLAGLSARRRRK